jgi:putative peptidoglycan lipid II flippase
MIVRIMAPGFMSDPEKFNMTVMLNRVMFPYLVVIGLTAYSMGILNSLKHFAAPAFGPCLMNLILIASTVWLYPRIGVMGLALGVLAGGAVQLALNMPFMYGHGINVNLNEGFRHPAVKRIGKLLMPRALGSAVYQINIFVDTILASLSSVVGAGGVAALYYANRLIQFPLAIFGLALAQAALPKMSREFAANDVEGMKETLSFSLRAVFLIMVPASFGLAVLGLPIIKMLFQRGAFTAYSTSITESALFFYSFGLLSYGGIKLLVTAFYSMHDTKTPVKTAFAAVIMNVVLNLILMWPMKLGGLALATSISASFNFIMLYILLRNKLGDFGTKVIIDSFLRVLAASLVMTAVLKTLSIMLAHLGTAGLCVTIASGMISFLVAGYVIGVKEIRGFSVWILKRR